MNRLMRRVVLAVCGSMARPFGMTARRLTVASAAAGVGLFTFGAAAQPYCTAGSANCNLGNLDERITRVVLHTLDQSSDPNISPPGCYTDYTGVSTTLQRGSSFAVSVEYSNSFAGDKGVVWIDWNRDFDFDDANETFVLTRTPNLFSGTVSVPMDAPLGSTRMRVRVTYSGTAPACGEPSQNYGEVQDFSVSVAAATTGACCMAGVGDCNVTTPGSCGGTYQGDGTSCSPTNPCGGACCTGQTCTVTLASSCPMGSLFFNGGVCSASSCRHCDAGVANCNSTGNELITRVIFANLDNSTPADDFLPCYSDFTTVQTQVSPGSTYAFRFEYANPAAADQGTVWFDWNRDFVFGDVASGEQVILTHPIGEPAAFAANITVPAGASLGETRMRVRVMWTGTPAACGDASYGEVEDYGILVSVATTGACCMAGSPVCTVTTPGACAGTFQGNATTCTPFNPCGGACCTGGTCVVSLASACASGGSFLPSAVCTPTLCQYCEAGVSSCNTTGNELITRVVFAGIDHSTAPDPFLPCSNDFTSISTQVFRNTTYEFTFEYAEATALDQGIVWFDWNRDFTLGNVTSGEQIVLAHPPGNPNVFTALVTVPADASIGDARMRVRVMYSGAQVACGNASFGEVEDYTISIAVATTGACCGTSGDCAVTTPAACTGVFQGLGTACTFSNPCGGACCSTSGACTVTTAGTCPSGSTYLAARVCSVSACTGACCDTSGNCVTVNAAAECAGGVFAGAGVSCFPSPCLGQSCANPIELTLGVVQPGDMNNSVATSSISCSSGSHGLWYSFTAPFAGTYTFASTVTSVNGTPSLALFSACNAEITCVNPFTSTASVNQAMTTGQTIIFREGAANNVFHTYDLLITVLGGACCSGATCSITSQSGCDGFNRRYVGNGTVCNVAGNSTTPCCKADYNQSGAITVQDIFDFLSGYFTSASQADFNNSGSVTVQDIFDFLSAYFIGCI